MTSIKKMWLTELTPRDLKTVTGGGEKGGRYLAQGSGGGSGTGVPGVDSSTKAALQKTAEQLGKLLTYLP